MHRLGIVCKSHEECKGLKVTWDYKRVELVEFASFLRDVSNFSLQVETFTTSASIILSDSLYKRKVFFEKSSS